MPERFYKTPFSTFLRLVNAGEISVEPNFVIKLLSQFGARKIDVQEFRKQISALLDEYVKREKGFDENEWTDKFVEAIPQNFLDGLLSANSAGRILSAFCIGQITQEELYLFLGSRISETKKRIKLGLSKMDQGSGMRRRCA
jgi:hypothetical protein